MKWRFSINNKEGIEGTLEECQQMLAKHVSHGYDNTYTIEAVLEEPHYAYRYNANGVCERIDVVA